MYERFAEHRIREELEDTRVVLISGPRQAGKTTLARRFAGEGRVYRTLDDGSELRAATGDPTGFVRDLDRAVIDEIQRVPDLILAIKVSVDTDTRPGRFLLTGSANLRTHPRIADSLAGRMSIVGLLPLAQAEMRGVRSGFLDRVFAGELPACRQPVVGSDLVAAVFAGGYPEAVRRSSWRRRQSWYTEYVDAVIQRDVRDLARLDRLAVMPTLLAALAEYSGGLVNYSRLGAAIGLSHTSTRKYVAAFEHLFLIRTVQPWYSNSLKRILKSPKLHFLDSGLLAALRNLSPENMWREKAAFGPVLESFVFGELLKLATWARGRYRFYHFRDKQRNEVDFVIENGDGDVVGIEVKASATVRGGDFSGLRRLASACGDRLKFGLVLCDRNNSVPFGNRMWAAPISLLWT